MSDRKLRKQLSYAARLDDYALSVHYKTPLQHSLWLAAREQYQQMSLANKRCDVCFDAAYVVIVNG